MYRLSWLCVVVLLAVSASVAAGQPPAKEESLDEDVAKAIQKGVKNLWDQRQADGSWPTFTMQGHVFSMGTTVLAASSPVLALPGREINEPKYRRATRARLGGNAREHQLRGVTVGGRLAVVWSREDLTGGLVGYPSYAIDGYAPATAYEIVRNAVLLASGAGEPTPAPASATTEAAGS